MIYIFDIDGTLCDLSHRLHFIQQKPSDWDAFFAACPGDSPISEVIGVARALYEDHDLWLISGRSDAVRKQTIQWFDEHGCNLWMGLLMRKAGDHRPDNIVKAELLDELLQRVSGKEIGGVFEDRQQVVDMYRERGLRVFQVANGAF